MRILFVAVVLFAMLPLGAVAQPAPPRYVVSTSAQVYADTALLALDRDGLRIDDAGVRRTIPRVVELRQEGATLPALPTRNFLALTNGDRIPLDAEAAVSLQGSKLRVWPAQSLPIWHETGLTLFAPHVVLLFWSVPDGVDDADLFFAKLTAERRKRDIVFLKNGDRLQGTLSESGAKAGVVLTVDGRKTPTPWSRIAGIAWNTDRQARLRTKSVHWHAVLAGGARLNLTELRLDEKAGVWMGKTQFGAALEIPRADMVNASVRLGPAVDLAELTPSRFEQRPYLGIAWPLAKNAAVTGHPLRLSNGTYENGLGMHAPCRVTYKLAGAFHRFDSLVGFDESRCPRGKARLAVELDGKRIDLFDGKDLTSRDPPLTVQLDVRGVREMTLIADLGSFGDVQAHVNWADARLIKKE